MSESPPPFDQDFAAELVGKTLLIGLTYVRYSGEPIEQRQLYGVVESAGPEVVVVRLSNGGEYRLPPDFRGVEPAPPGTYTLRSTGECIENPDYLCSWTITRPDA